MIIDKNLQLSDGQTLTTTATSADTIDAGATRKGPQRDIGDGEQLYAVFVMDSNTAAAGAATVTFAIQDSADNATFADVVASGPIGKAALAAGAHVVLPLPPGMRRYIRANYTVATGPLTGGKVSAQIVLDYQRNVAFASALS